MLSAKLALPNKYFSAQNALKLTYRHLGFQKFSRADTPGSPLEGKGEGGGWEGAGKGPYQIVSLGPPTCKYGPN